MRRASSRGNEASVNARVTLCAKVSGPELATVEKVEVQQLIDNNDSGLGWRGGGMTIKKLRQYLTCHLLG